MASGPEEPVDVDTLSTETVGVEVDKEFVVAEFGNRWPGMAIAPVAISRVSKAQTLLSKHNKSQ